MILLIAVTIEVKKNMAKYQSLLADTKSLIFFYILTGKMHHRFCGKFQVKYYRGLKSDSEGSKISESNY